MSDARDDTPARERVIEPPPGHHEAPMPEKPIPTTQARQGVTFGHMRWVLLASLALVIVALIVAALVS